MMPNMRLQVAVIALPVPLEGVGNSSGVYEYSTEYMTLLVKLNAQFHPKSEFESNAIVEPYRNTPVSTVESDSVPLRPNRGLSTKYAPTRAPGTPATAMTREFRYVRYVDPSPKSAPLAAWMKGRKELYSGYPSPNNHDETGGESQALRGKQCTDPVKFHLLQVALDNRRDVCLRDIALGFACLQLIHSQTACLSVSSSNLVDNTDGFLVIPPGR